MTPSIHHAHAHNDYKHERPLLDALSHGFTSVEADVFLAGGELLVAAGPRWRGEQRARRRGGTTTSAAS